MSTEPQEPLHIVQLKVSNVKGIEAAHITPDGAVVHITGRNGAGKSSVLDAIEYALAGTRSQPPRPVRDGAKTAQVVVEAGEFTVTRRWGKDKHQNTKSTLSVTRKNGAPIPSPQKFLDELVGPIAFDPGLFLAMSRKEQGDVAREVLGLDFTELDEQRAALYAERTRIGHDVTRLKGVVQNLPMVQAPDREIDIPSLAGKLEAAQAIERENLAAADAVGRTRDTHANMRAAVERAEQEHKRAVEESQRRLDAAKRELARAQVDHEAAAEQAKNPKPIDPSIEALRAGLKTANDTNQLVRAKQERAKAERELGAVVEAFDDKTAAITRCDEEKERLLAEAQWPVEGLGFDDEGVAFNGLPLEQAALSEGLSAALGLGVPDGSRFRVILMREGGHYDTERREQVRQFAEDHNLQVWFETPSDGDGPPGAIVIEDGHVREEEATDATNNG